MGKKIDYPHAGISLAIPMGFQLQNVREPYDVMRAVFQEDLKALQAVTLSVYPVAQKVTADGFAEAMVAELKKVLAIRHLTIKKKIAIRVAGTDGTACTLKYTFRGVKTLAGRVYFIREFKNAGKKIRLCYVLTVESGPEKKGTLLPILGEVMKTLQTKALNRPVNMPISVFGQVHMDDRNGFFIRPPLGWSITPLPAGAVLTQTDYIQGESATPIVRVTVGELSEAASSKDEAVKYLNIARKTFLGVKVLKQEPVKLAGREAYQFVLRYVPPKKPSSKPILKTDSDKTNETAPPVIILQRVLCIAGEKEKAGKSYSIVMICQGGKAKTLMQNMDKICSQFKLVTLTTAKPIAPANK